jgi:hypothetical protein
MLDIPYWSRFTNRCTYDTQPPCNTCVIDELQYKKGNILQYKANSSCLTKSQKYAQLATGRSTSRTKTYASQSQQYTDSNTNSLAQVGYTNLNINTLPFPTLTQDPITPCPVAKPIDNNALPANIPFSNDNNIPPVIPPVNNDNKQSNNVIPNNPNNDGTTTTNDIIIKNGGNLICTIVQNKCTSEIMNVYKNQECYSTTFSNVPGPGKLCWTGKKPTYYPRNRNTYSSGGSKFPTNAILIPVNQCP